MQVNQSTKLGETHIIVEIVVLDFETYCIHITSITPELRRSFWDTSPYSPSFWSCRSEVIVSYYIQIVASCPNIFIECEHIIVTGHNGW